MILSSFNNTLHRLGTHNYFTILGNFIPFNYHFGNYTNYKQQDFQMDGSFYSNVFIDYITVTCLEWNLLPSCFDRMRSVILIIQQQGSLFNFVYVCGFLEGLLESSFSFHHTEADIRKAKIIKFLHKNILNQADKQKTKKSLPYLTLSMTVVFSVFPAGVQDLV